MKRSISYYEGLARESWQEKKPSRDLYKKIDVHRLGKWKPSPELAKLPYIQGHNFSSTQPADALDAGARTFATMLPKITITPTDPSAPAYEEAERQETLLDWHLRKMNSHGKKSVHWKLLESAMYYCGVAFETEYLPYKFKGAKKDKRMKQIMNGSAFRWVPHPISNVAPLHSSYGLESYTLVKNISLQDAILEYGEDHPAIQKFIKNHFDGKEPTPADKIQTQFTYVKVVDWENRAEWLSLTAGDQINETFSSKDRYILTNEEHGLDFIPCVVADNEDPILKNAINTGLLDNLNNMRLINFVLAVKYAGMPQLEVTSPDGTMREVHIDASNPLQPISHPPSTNVESVPQPRLPDGLREKEAQLTEETSTSTVARILSDANRLMGTENFSTANLAFNIALGSLSLARSAAERAYEMGLYQMYQWIDHAGNVPLTGYRQKTSEGGDAGEELIIKKGDFDLGQLYINVKMQEFSMLDKQAKVNLAITEVERLGFSRKVVAEEIGVENYDLHVLQRGEEDLVAAKINAEAQKVMADAEAYAAKVVGAAQAEVQMMTQQMMMQMQQQQQAPGPGQGQGNNPPPGPGAQVADMNASFPASEGVDPRGGGIATAQSNPGETAETITGVDAAGNELA